MKKNLLLLLFTIAAITTQAQWKGDSTLNTSICNKFNTSTKNSLVSISDGNGGMWLAWEDTRNTATTGTDIYCQHIKKDGTLLLDSAGVLVTNATGNQTSISITDDGSNGIILSWTDAQAGNNDIYVQRIKSDGTIGYTANGVAISNSATFNELGAVTAKLNATEVLIVWRDNRLGNTDIFANKISIATGSKIFASDSVIVNATNNQNNQQVLADGAGGAYIIWEDPRVSTSKAGIYAQYINNSGVPQWVANGIAVCDPNASGIANNRQYPKFVSDGAGGIVATWADLRNGTTNNDIYAQRINSSGAAVWLANGIAICNASGNQTVPFIVKSGNSFFITWYDIRNGTSDVNVYAQAVAADGTIMWDVNGTAVCTSTGNQPSSSSPTASSRNLNIISDGVDGVIIIWDDARNTSTNIDVYAQRIKADKTFLWATNGVAISSATGNQSSPISVSDGTGGAIVIWQDGRTNANCELYGDNLLSTGILPVSFTAITATPKNNTIIVEWSTASEINNSHFEIERSIDAVTFKNIGSIVAKNTASNYLFTDTKALLGDNFYRIKSIDKDGTYQYSKTVKANISNTFKGSVNIYPNPVINTVTVQLNNTTKCNYLLRLLDLRGVQLLQSTVIANSNLLQKTINLSAFSKGNYVLQIVDESGKILTSQLIVKQ